MDYVWSALGYNTATNGAGPAAESVAVPPAPAAEGESERPDWTKMMTGGCPVSVFLKAFPFMFPIISYISERVGPQRSGRDVLNVHLSVACLWCGT